MRTEPFKHKMIIKRQSMHAQWLKFSIGVLIAASLGACTTEANIPRPEATILLVSLEDGSIIRQEIVANADVCMKSIGDPATTCFQQGAPILSGEQIIGYEMIRSDIQLLPK